MLTDMIVCFPVAGKRLF